MAPSIQLTNDIVNTTEDRALSQVLDGAAVNGSLLPRDIPETVLSAATEETPALFSLKGTTTLITGAGRGLGITLTAAVVEAGGHMACVDILHEPSAEEWRLLQKKSAAKGLGVSYHRCDVTNEESMQEVFSVVSDVAHRRHAPLSGTIACAGIQQSLPAIDYPKTDFDRILGVNVTGAFLTAKYAAKKMMEHNVKGSIVMIASMSGQIANRGINCTAYNTSKAAVQQMCRSLAQEWG
ncbi:hypothetical protein LTR70_010143 [Exophiala xenobiotica]|uniref:Uncharacterized protein n=1 Tax=Lithohypha guttulata TaxID=1690604 RepID=A0ABR0JV05_9EURO|nr:hypothetical protein LTR24_010100 [Lithohypha guttulata]KAK5309602.1 hypothetical protein LTR70_010143 [Exophiala xenobiotica]